jgi:three-Cys-motif partner protein
MSNEWRDDGLALPEVGPWAKRKYHFLSRYLRLFSTGMKKKWPERHYVDLFAGAGAARIKDTNEIVMSSALLAASVQDPFTYLHLCDSNPQNTMALSARLEHLGASKRAFVETGDANEKIDAILSRIPKKGALCLTFVDPFGLHFDFDTAQAIAQRRSDLIILLADNMDALRNWNAYYFDNPKSALDRFIGEPGWREIFLKELPERRATALREKYFNQLKSLGYEFFDSERVANSGGRDIYSLVYASRSPVGLNFWKKAASVDEGGQRSFSFD